MEGSDPSNAARDDLANALGLTVPKIPHRIVDSTPVGAPSDSDALDIGPEWNGREDQLFRIWNAATRRTTTIFNPARRAVLPRQNRLYGFEYMRWIGLVTSTETYTSRSAWPQRSGSSHR